MATIPELRARLAWLQSLARTLLDELSFIEVELHRRPAGKKAKLSSTRMTPKLRSSIQACAAMYPDMAQATIAKRFNVNIGRVSETLKGKRK